MCIPRQTQRNKWTFSLSLRHAMYIITLPLSNSQSICVTPLLHRYDYCLMNNNRRYTFYIYVTSKPRSVDTLDVIVVLCCLAEILFRGIIDTTPQCSSRRVLTFCISTPFSENMYCEAYSLHLGRPCSRVNVFRIVILSLLWHHSASFLYKC